MFNSEKNVYIQETEIKPNKYAFLVLLFCMACVISCWILNEIGIFRVGDAPMRIGTVITVITVAIPAVLLLLNKSNYAKTGTKYLIMTSLIIFTMSVTTLMTFHTTIMLLLPISIAMLYRSKSLGTMALLGSFVSAIISPVLGYAIGVWDVNFLRELIMIATGCLPEIVNPDYSVKANSIFEIMLYIVLPRLMLVGAYGVLMFHVIELGSEHVDNQIELNRISHKDALTGLYNQNYYKDFISSTDTGIDDIAVIFFDVNDLKKLNDMYGHEQGDLLLKRCADSILGLCDNEKTGGFRIGGDEFLIIMDGADESEVREQIDRWQLALAEINEENREIYDGLVCSMACGYNIGKFSSIIELVAEADNNMYINKKKMKSEAK